MGRGCPADWEVDDDRKWAAKQVENMPNVIGIATQILAISWEEHRRTKNLCAGLGISLIEFTHNGGRISRYFDLCRRTFQAVKTRRPTIVLVQNPSMVLALLCWFASKVVGKFKLVVDAHNEAVVPYIHRRWPFPQIARFLHRRANATIVTNELLAEIIASHGGRPIVLPDRLPDVPIRIEACPSLERVMRVMVIATFAPDEPIKEILLAANRLGDAFEFSVTGRDSKLSTDMRRCLSPNVRLTGYLAEEDYWHLMARSHLIVDLTLMPECLVCGAYEALAMGRPMVLSDNLAGRYLFDKSAIFTKSDSGSIEEAIINARTHYDQLSGSISEARERFNQKWQQAADRMLHAIQS